MNTSKIRGKLYHLFTNYLKKNDTNLHTNKKQG